MLALDDPYRPLEGTEQPEWMFERLIDGLDRICGTLRLTGSDLHVNTNSDRRMDGVLATIWELDPEAAVISDERQPITNTRDAARLAGELPSAGSGAGTGLIAPEDLAPEVQEALAEHMRNYEKQWLDMAIPALHGLTPREAAEDPTRRDDLVRLLASFGDERGQPDDDEPRRLRAAPRTGAEFLRHAQTSTVLQPSISVSVGRGRGPERGLRLRYASRR